MNYYGATPTEDWQGLTYRAQRLQRPMPVRRQAGVKQERIVFLIYAVLQGLDRPQSESDCTVMRLLAS
jgi:hypothetical protein